MTEKIKVFKHNSICIDVEGRAVYVDPFEMDETPGDAAFILVTHDHYDHFSPEASLELPYEGAKENFERLTGK